MRSFALVGALIWVIAGCQGDPGSGHRNLKVGDLKVGGEAKLVSSDGSDILLDRIVGPAQRKTGRRSPKTSKVEKLKLPVGTTALVQDIVGDDAYIMIKDGSSAGSNCWVECIRLEPLAK